MGAPACLILKPGFFTGMLQLEAKGMVCVILKCDPGLLISSIIV